MFGTRRFMDEAPLFGHPVFQSLGGESLGQGAAVTPTPPPVVDASKVGTKVSAALIGLGVGFLALELVGTTNVTGIRKLVSR